MQYLKYIILCLGFATTVNAQQEIGLYSLNDLWQSNQLNPAFITDKPFTIGLPGVRQSYLLNGIRYSDFLREDTGVVVRDFQKAISKMDNINTIRNDFQFETLSIVYLPEGKDLQVSFGHSIRSSAYLRFSKDLIKLFDYLNSK